LINFTPHDALNKPFLFNKTLSDKKSDNPEKEMI